MKVTLHTTAIYFLANVSMNFSKRSFRLFSSCTNCFSSSLISVLCRFDSSVKVSMQLVSSLFFLFLVVVGVNCSSLGLLSTGCIAAVGLLSTVAMLPADAIHGGLTAGSLSRMGRRASMNSHVDLPRPVSRLASATFLYLQYFNDCS